MSRAAGRPDRYLPEPASLHQPFDKILYLNGIQALAERVAADILTRDFGLVVLPNPPQHGASLGVALTQANLTQRGAAVRPEVITHEPHGCIHKTHFYDIGLWRNKRLAGS
jgi:hypothetical protein